MDNSRIQGSAAQYFYFFSFGYFYGYGYFVFKKIKSLIMRRTIELVYNDAHI
jgi:hypothetical protein